jgi:hypothetical protein
MSADGLTDQSLSLSDSPESSLLIDSGGRSWTRLAAALVVVAAFWFIAGPVGGGAALVILVLMFVLGTPSAIAAGIVVLLVLTPNGIDPLAAIVAVSGLLSMVLASTPAADSPIGYVGAVLGVTGMLGVFSLLLVASQPLWLAAGVLIGTGTMIVYFIDRYHQLRLGLLHEESSSSETNQPNTTTTTSNSQ